MKITYHEKTDLLYMRRDERPQQVTNREVGDPYIPSASWGPIPQKLKSNTKRGVGETIYGPGSYATCTGRPAIRR